MKKLVSLVLALIMALSLASFVSAENEEITLKVMLPDFNSDKDWVTLEDGNPVLQHIYEATGVKLDIQWVADSAYGEMTSLTVADPANMPEVMVMQGVRDAIMISTARAGNGFIARISPTARSSLPSWCVLRRPFTCRSLSSTVRFGS